jgi:hypothetical protein
MTSVQTEALLYKLRPVTRMKLQKEADYYSSEVDYICVMKLRNGSGLIF